MTSKFKKSGNTFTYLAFSGGKDATAMLHEMIRRGESFDRVVFYDGGWDWPELNEHVAQVERNTGVKIERVRPEHDYIWYATEKPVKGRHGPRSGYGWPNHFNRWCTALKRDCLNRWKRQEIPRGAPSVACLGIAANETDRIHPAPGIRYPLVEYGLTEEDTLNLCYKLGYRWGGLYEKRSRFSCYCCPLQRLGELKYLKHERPELWSKMLAVQDKINQSFVGPYESWRTFRPNKDLHVLDSEL